MKAFLITLFIFSLSFGASNTNLSASSETSLMANINQDNNASIDYSKYFKLLKIVQADMPLTKLIYAKFTKEPKLLYDKQRFYLDITCTVVADKFDKILTRFGKMKNLELLNPASAWKFTNANEYTNRFYFKVENPDFALPRFQISLKLDNKIIDSLELISDKIPFSKINDDLNQFSNIIAQNIDIENVKAKQYNNKQLLVIVQMKGQNSNLEDFHLDGIKEQGMLSLDNNDLSQKLFYYLIVPIYDKTINFKYLDITSHTLKEIHIPIIIDESLVSTQSDLNPNTSSYMFYKKIAIFILGLFFVILFLLSKKRILFLLFALCFLAYFAYLMFPNKVLIVQANAKVRIIPTYNSSIFYKFQSAQGVSELDRRRNFIKILFKNKNTGNQNIGWIKEDKLVKN